ncbi:MAG: acetylglutamate kinase [Fusobacteriaceae bacterium]|nr:acetylglutamate kinase [Fusobacteriaceae bacterium]
MLDENIKKAEVLLEALPYMQSFIGKTVVIKFGGNVMDDPDMNISILNDILFLKQIGINIVLVHGGGPAITDMLEKLQIKSEFINGNRVTDEKTMEIVEMVLTGKINKELVGSINKLGGRAVGISGKDANLFVAEKKFMIIDGEEIDLGRVGKVKKINTEIIETITKSGYIPVISPVAVDEDGNSYNINADYAAGELAGALNADKFILLTNVKGVMRDLHDDSTLYSKLYYNEVYKLINGGIIVGGMLPKVEACMTAINAGVSRSHILDGRIKHSLLLEIFTDEGIGTMIVSKTREERLKKGSEK